MAVSVLESTHKVLFKVKEIWLLLKAYEYGSSEVTSHRKRSVRQGSGITWFEKPLFEISGTGNISDFTRWVWEYLYCS